MADPGADLPLLTAQLRRAGCVFAEDEARELAGAAPDAAALAAMVRRRIAGEPLELIVGSVAFCGLRLRVAAGVFVPRRRTEFLAELAVHQALGRTATVDGCRPLVVDLCCGVGAIGAVVLDRVSAVGAGSVVGIDLFATDVDPAAVGCARLNLPDATVRCGDLFDALPPTVRGRIDVLAANAPYVPTGSIALMPPEAREHEPAVALDGGADGLAVHRRILAAAGSWLAPSGTLLIEIGESQQDVAVALAEANGLRASIRRDDERAATVLIASATG